MVPAGMIKKMYGASIFYDEVTRTVEKQLQGYLTTEKPELLGQPLPVASDLTHLVMNNPVVDDLLGMLNAIFTNMSFLPCNKYFNFFPVSATKRTMQCLLFSHYN